MGFGRILTQRRRGKREEREEQSIRGAEQTQRLTVSWWDGSGTNSWFAESCGAIIVFMDQVVAFVAERG